MSCAFPPIDGERAQPGGVLYLQSGVLYLGFYIGVLYLGFYIWGFISGVVRSDHISTCAGGNRQRSSCGREVEPLRGFGWGARCLPRPVLLRRDRAATHAHVAQPRSLLGIQLGCERQRVRRLWRRQLARAPEAVAGRPVAPRLSPKECRATPSRQARPEEA